MGKPPDGKNKLLLKDQNTERLYASLLEQSPDPIFAFGREGRYLYVNKAFADGVGKRLDQIVGKTIYDVFDREEAEKRIVPLQQAMESGVEKVIEVRVPQPGGDKFYITTITPVPDINGIINTAICSSKDITERKRMEMALRKSEEKYRLLIEHSSDMIWNMDAQGRFTYVSPSWTRITGYEPEAMIGTQFHPIVHPDDVLICWDYLQETISDKEKPPDPEYRVLHADGTWHWHTASGTPVLDEERELASFVGISRDITERKQAEIRQEELRRQLEQVIESLPDATFVISNGGEILFWNKAIEEMTGCSKAQMIGKGNFEHALPFYGERRSILIDLALLSGEEYEQLTSKYDFIRMEGDTILGEVYVPGTYGGKGGYLWGSASKLRDASGNIVGAIESIRDITDRKELERLLFDEKEKFRTTLLSVADGVIATDDRGRVLLFNGVAEKLTGWTQAEALGKPLENVFHVIYEDSRQRRENPISRVLETGNTVEFTNHIVLISRDGVERPIEDTASPITNEDGNIIGVVLVFRDFTEKREKQKEIAYLSFHDQLTGLYNRRFFEEELKRLDKERNLPLTLVMADVNGLKLTNDAFGHLLGDRLLQNAAEVMRREFRADDIIARIGGDEFVVLLPKTTSEQTAQIIKRIYKSIAEVKLDSIVLSISFGWETKQNVTEEIKDIFKKAEDGMYRRKLYESRSMRNSTIKMIMKALYEKNNREQGHSTRVSRLCEAMGRSLGLTGEDVNELRTVGLMHDIGRIIIDDHILDKECALNNSEWLEIRRHCETGYRILSSVNEFSRMAEYVLAHHERWDGTGYPKGLKREQIPLGARIIAVADAYDAMTSHRPYRKALSREAAIQEISNNSGTQFDPRIALVFLENNIIDNYNYPEY